MTQEIEMAGFQIPQVDWDATPASVKALMALLLSLLQQTQEQFAPAQKQVAELQEQQSGFQERLSHLEEQVKLL